MPENPRPIDFQSAFHLFSEARRRAREAKRPILVSVTQPFLQAADPARTFAAAAGIAKSRFLLAQHNERRWIVGAGSAAEIKVNGQGRFPDAIAAQKKILASAIIEAKGRTTTAGPLFIGCFRFTQNSTAIGPWREIPDSLLILPTWCFVREENRLWMTMNILVDQKTSISSLEQQLQRHSRKFMEHTEVSSHSQVTLRKNHRGLKKWQHNVEEILSKIRSEKLTKVTLARTLEVRSKAPFKPETVVRKLISAYPGCLVFSIVHRGACFLGATPEELVSLEGNHVSSRCLAGSAWSSSSHGNDHRLRRQLLGNDKEQREHEVVADWVQEHLARFCRQVKSDKKPRVVKLGHLHHLATRFKGLAENGTHVLELVAALHPTPAVAGSPLRPALQTIRRLENFDRGWYAGPIGWVNQHGKGQFGVAIRSALLRGNRAILYAGAGIVAGSNQRREYEETEMKFVPLLTALGAH